MADLRQKSCNGWRSPIRMLCWLLACGSFSGLWLLGCNEYPLQILRARRYVEVTDSLVHTSNRAVDVLFVIDNSCSMNDEQLRLRQTFETFVTELVKQDLNNYQIGVITTDMTDSSQQGKLQGRIPIIRGQDMSKAQVVQTFQENADVGIQGSGYEKALEAMKTALSPELLGPSGHNKGFLRPDTLLAVIFVGDEDDCSHDKSITPSEFHPEACRFPSTQVVRDLQSGETVEALHTAGPHYGIMEKLVSTSHYIQFLEGLKRPVVVGGIIGNPVAKDAQQGPWCGFRNPSNRVCAGCLGKDEKGQPYRAGPGFRLYDLIQKFGGQDAWSPICGNKAGFEKTLLELVGLFSKRLQLVPLSHLPLDPDGILLQVIPQQQDKASIRIERAVRRDTPCRQDSDCGAGSCGPDSRCYGDGWILIPGEQDSTGKIIKQAQLKLSGRAIQSVPPGSQLKVIYVAR